MKKLSVLMPVYNEARTLRTIVSRVLAAPVELEIELICVDDGSTDDSLEILRELAEADHRIHVIAQPQNMGKGKAIRTAIEHMTGDIGIVQDSDLEYNPAEYPRVIAPILAGDADAVYGSRFAYSEVRRVLFYWHSLGNRFLTTLSNMANDVNLTDMETCYKAVRGDLLKRLRLTRDRFGFEPEITARLAHAGARIYEVPISYHGRTYAEGKSIGWRDGLEALWLIVKFRFFDTKPTDHPGHETLESLASTPAVSKWVLSRFEPNIGDRILEAGCGMGNMTAHLIGRKALTVVDLDDEHVRSVRRRFGQLENITVLEGDLEDPGFYRSLGSFDTVLCVNVLEHMDKPEAAIRGFHSVLTVEGRALILVPAHAWLFSDADRAIGHRRRYRVAEVRSLLEESDFEVLSCSEFNRLGVFGWYINKLMGRTSIGRWQARAFGLMLPVARILEGARVLPGLSVVAVARRRAEPSSQ
jgi:SAM-dependent methyltransferase